MVVTNLENEKFSDELGRILLTNQSVKTAFLDEIVRVAKSINSKKSILILNIYALLIKMLIFNF